MEQNRRAAKEHVRQLREFYSHVVAYIIINAFLIAINLLTTPDTLWFYWVSLAWGLGLAFHAYDTFFKERVFGSAWEERKIQKYMREHPGEAGSGEPQAGKKPEESEPEQQRKSA